MGESDTCCTLFAALLRSFFQLHCIMGNKLSQSFTRREGEAKGELINDRMTELPDDVLWSIMSSLTLKEAAATSLVSHKWNKRIWRTFRLLNFEDARAMAKVQRNSNLIDHERSSFLQVVNNVVEGYRGETIDEFRVSFDLDFSCQSYINSWVNFALDKQVKRFDLDLQRKVYVFSPCCSLPLECCQSLEKSYNNLHGFKHPLTSLRLNNVDVTTGVVDCFLRTCPHLDNLFIQNSKSLEIIRVSGASLPLKHLTVYSCENMKTIDISAPKLLSFRYRSSKLKELSFRDVPDQLKELHIRDASSLQQVLFRCGIETFSTNLDSLSKYFSQLEYLSLTIYSSLEGSFGVNHFDALTSLKHLVLTVSGPPEESVLGWTPLIEASPILEKLTLKMVCRRFAKSRRKEVTRAFGSRPLKSLKTLDIRDFLGSCMELQLINYVVGNAIVLKEVMVRVNTLVGYPEELLHTLQVEDKSPSGAKLIYKEKKC